MSRLSLFIFTALITASAASLADVILTSDLRCECRYTRIHNNWGEVELAYMPGAGVKFQYYHKYFNPAINDNDMAAACETANSDLVEAGLCSQIVRKKCKFGLSNCDQ